MYRICVIAFSIVLAGEVDLGVGNFKGIAESAFHRFRRQTYENSEAAEKQCTVTGPLQNGRYFIDPKRCPPSICILAPGAPIPSGWNIFYECNPGYLSSTTKTTSTCKSGVWSPELPTCYACGSSSEIGSVTPLISNGKNANVGSFPWHVGLYFPEKSDGEVSWVQQCGGSLVNAQFVVTAAHCIVVGGKLRKEEEVKIGLGKYYRSWNHYEDNEQKRDVISITYQNNNYNQQSLYFDIALIMMDKKVEFGRYVMPVCFGNPYESNYLHSNKLFVAGWGLTENEKPSDVLQHTDVSILPRDDCETRIPSSYFLLEKLCTLKNSNTNAVVREGDSGGGLTVVYKGHHYIVGIVSLHLSQVTLFTNINFSIHKAWLEEEMNSKKSTTEKVKINPTTTSPQECTKSETTVNGKTVCKGDVVFEDNFSGKLSNKWRHYIYIPDNTINIGMNLHTGDKNIGFTSGGSLIFKPTVLNNTFVTSGSIKLEGCTFKGQCEGTGSPDSILPPIANAWIHTFNSFYFRYGKVEIRAKLPVGDWLAPEFRLRNKLHSYGTQINSGNIRIVRRGNSDLICGGKDEGLKKVEFWVEFGPQRSGIHDQYSRKNLPENWDDQYHNFAIIWRPGNITFEIDNEFIGVTPVKNTVCENAGFEKEDCESTYGKDSTIAPFDKDFYLSLGLTAANTNYFPDSCINRGKPKPWKNNQPESRLEFWEDRDNWRPTWTEEGSALYIDYIRVTAL